jgi:GGDEF domain-containing protein
MSQPSQGLTLVALVGAGEPEVPVLAELHRNPRVHIIGIYDPDPAAIGHELAEILGLRHASSVEFLDHLASAQYVVLPRDRHRFEGAVALLKDRGARFLNQQEALTLLAAEPVVTRPLPPQAPPQAEEPLARLEEAMRWLERALDREELLRALLSIGIQAARADNGSIQLLDPATSELYIAYAEGLSDHTIRSSQQKLGEGIAGSVAASRTARLIQGESAQLGHQDRPDIRSAICVPLVDSERLLGVLNVSCDAGSRRLERADLDRLLVLAARISHVLARLVEIQELYERALVDDLERELDRLYQLDGDLVQSLGLARGLLQDVSGARSLTLVLLTPDGPACRIVAQAQGATRAHRDVDPAVGILGQALLTHEIVVLEEKVRPAGERRSRRTSVLYVPLGSPEPFAALIAEFEGLSALAHFQRGLGHVLAVLTPRVGALLAREESRGRIARLRQLATGLSRLSVAAPGERAQLAAGLLAEVSGAQAVAVWDARGERPAATVLAGTLEGRELAPLWTTLRARLRDDSVCRIREVDPHGSELTSLLLAGAQDGAAVAAINRAAAGPLDEIGFRDEDLDAAGLLLQALAGGRWPVAPSARAQRMGATSAFGLVPPPAPAPAPAAAGEWPTNRQLLLESIERELARAQRYHFGFSLTCFQVDLPHARWEALRKAVEERVQEIRRATDCVLWIAAQRFVVLAPEEARGQRLLARRLQSQLQQLLTDLAPGAPAEVTLAHAAYPQDGETPAELLDACERQLPAPPP